MATTDQTTASGSVHQSGVRSAGQRPRAIAAAVLGVVLVAFGALNSQSVTIHWIVATTHAPLIIVIFGCGAIGFGVCWLVARLRLGDHEPAPEQPATVGGSE
jgi:uncharacterized integral membrane protein